MIVSRVIVHRYHPTRGHTSGYSERVSLEVETPQPEHPQLSEVDWFLAMVIAASVEVLAAIAIVSLIVS